MTPEIRQAIEWTKHYGSVSVYRLARGGYPHYQEEILNQVLGRIK